MASTAPVDCTCAVCGKECRKRRCSRCHKVNYCSRTCQRIDWYDRGHKSKCEAPAHSDEDQALSPLAAWGELQKTLIQMSPKEAHRQFQMAQDEIKKLEEVEKQRLEATKDGEPTKSNCNVLKEEKKATSPAIEDVTGEQYSEPQSTNVSCERFLQRDWIYLVEEMPNISSYQVTLWHTPRVALHDRTTLQLSMQHSSQGNTIVSLCLRDDCLFSAQFPGRLVEASDMTNVVQRQTDCLSLRLQSRDVFDDSPRDDSSTSLEAINLLCCRYCDQPILTGTHAIEKVLPLPKGYWDEVTDYLICYNGQPAVDFSSASALAQEHLALEDSNLLVLHCNNVGNGICVLAVEGYGEESGNNGNDVDETPDSATFRGPRAWRDSVGGATLCCSQCCAVLGFASLTSPETFRLLKHRLSVKNDMQWNRLHSCASFVAHEIARYAESKAIYTFVVSVRSEGMASSAKELPTCILLKLLSWDTRQAKSIDSRVVEQTDILDFKPVVRVIYEIANDREAAASMPDDTNDPVAWTWGGVDLCCLPDGTPRFQKNVPESTQQPSAASVRLWLSQEEWDELHQSLLDSSKYFSKAVTEAMILIKLGPRKTKHEEKNSANLGALPFL